MHGHTPLTNTVLLITKMIGFVANQNVSQVSIWQIRTLPCIDKILNTSEYSWGYRLPIEMGIVAGVSSRPQVVLSKISS